MQSRQRASATAVEGVAVRDR